MIKPNQRSKDQLVLTLLFTHVPVVFIYSIVTNHPHVNWFAVLAFLVPLAAYCWKPASLFSRSLSAIGMVGFSAILIHLSGGLIEMHFHVFVGLVVLSLYNDWKVFAVAAIGVSLHHLLVLILPVYDVYASKPDLVIYALHILFVGLECLFLAYHIHAFKRQIKTISDQRESLKLASNHLLSVTGELNATARQQATGSQQQTNDISLAINILRELTTAAQAIATRTNVISQTTQEMNEVTQRVKNTANLVTQANERGQTTVANSVAINQQVSQLYDELDTIIVELMHESAEIKMVIETIREISSETHLLAVNATIEAAGAGAYGTRFAVIAGEVNALAANSLVASKQVATLLNRVDSRIQQAVTATKSGQTKIRAAHIAAEQGGQAIGELSRAIEQNNQAMEVIEQLADYVSQSTKEISTATTQQYNASEQAVRFLEGVSVVAYQTSTNSSQINQTAQNLEKLSSNLKLTLAG